MHWFRYYSEAADDPKVQCLSGDLFKFWINLLCLASERPGKLRGTLPTISQIAYRLRLAPEATDSAMRELAQTNLIEQDANGLWRPHNWEGRQRKSDSSTARVQKHRENKKRYRNGRGNGRKPFKRREEEEERAEQSDSSALSSSDAVETSPSENQETLEQRRARVHKELYGDPE